MPDKRRWVRLYAHPGIRAMPVAHVVWIVMTRSKIPQGWEVHHDNGNEEDDRYTNLFCLHPDDHRRLHAARRRLVGAVEEETVPF